MGGKGGKSAPPPDYSAVAASNSEAANVARLNAQDALAWAKEQYAADAEVTQRVLDVYLPAMESEAAAAAGDRTRYQTVFQPVEDQLLKEANEYASPGRMEQEASRAQSDVAQAFQAQRASAMSELESFGVDPSMARAGALDRSSRTMEAAASAGAANQSRLQTEAVGRALRGEAINLGRGYQSQIAQAYQTANNMGQGAVSSGLATTASGGQTMGTGTQWAGQQQGFLSNWGNNLAGQQAGVNSINAAKAQAGASQGSMIGAGVGAVASIAMVAI